ncbi:hypothetical protein D6825_02175 [Candidatus Woesearchaeota archaeon]|nr:MAG: hypothetical protein D6825_02175 [Candidatus Woesearchaeota archaeon]
MLSPYDWIYGISVLSAVLLSCVAGIIAIGLFKKSSQRKYLSAWKPLIVALVLFSFEEIFGALKVFGVWRTAWLTHVIPSFILVFLIWALIRQIEITRGCE